jgi:hypothetical protein
LTPHPRARFQPLLQGFIAWEGTLMGGEGGDRPSPSWLHAEREGHAPVVAVLRASAKGRRVHCCPQRARTLGPCGFFPANRPFSGDRRKAHDRRRGPPAHRHCDGGRRPCPRCGSTSRAVEKGQTSASSPPKELDLRTLSKIPAALQGFNASGGGR